MTVFKQRAGLLWSARSWGALGLLLTLMMVVVGCISIGTVPVPPKCITPPSGLLEWWPLDETSGNVVNNLISHPIAGHGSDLHNGTTNPGAISSTGPAAVSGMVNGALQFDGVDDFVEVPDGSGTLSHGNPTSDFTIDAWVKVDPQDASGVRPIVDKRFDFPDSQGPNVPTRGYAFYLYNGNLGFQLADDMVSPPGGLNQICDGGPPFTANCTNYGSPGPNVANGQWHHVAVTVQRTGTPTVTLYVDGSPVLTKGARTGNANSSIPLLIGSGYPIVISKPFFKGAIDELEIFDRALTQQEIQGIFKAGLAGKCKPQPSPTADLGDAPDSTNHANKQMTAYAPSVPARFPTVFDTTTGTPPGPKHLQPKGLAWLGKDVSFEDEADLLPDNDSNVTNIDPKGDKADRDGFDDGVKLPIAIPMDCGQTQFDYIVTSTGSAKLYVNVWFDFNRDGDWDDPIQKCALGPATTGSFTEWAVQNELINVPIGTTTFTTPVFGAANPTKGSDMWMRITLTDQPIAPAQGKDGSGPANGYKYGETEDYLLGLKYSELCGVKFNDLDGNGKQDANEPGLANWVIEVKDTNGNFIGYAVTNAQGQYCIVVPSPGTYTVSEQQQAGWTQTAPATPGTYTVTVPPAHTDLNFGNQEKKQKAEMCIFKFEDLDGDGVKDPNEPGLGGWQFNVSPAPLPPTTSPVTTQLPGGGICFGVSAPGTYTITEIVQAGWMPTTPNPQTVTVAPGQLVNVHFGNKKGAAACVTAPQDMVAWWPLDETSGTTANDLAGVANNNGTHVNGPTPTPGMVAGALRFDGVNDHVRVPDHAELDVGTGNFTLDTWVRTSASSGVIVLVDKRSGPTPLGYSLYLVNGRLGFQMANGVGSPTCAPTPTPGVACVNYVEPIGPNRADGQWHHVAAVVDRNDPNTGVRLYVDGVQVYTGQPMSGSLDNASDLYLGVRTPGMGGGGYLRGDLDEVEIFKRALTAQEVQAIYNAGPAGKCKAQAVNPPPPPTP